ncbi:hypothetical protein FHP05_10410 [Cerasibacillus terrae]|uniref:Putative phosphoesterase FHP05_10410 n=1 Tax=Cerasibacillus terrae TaxID=2498845 RepID=A0A5C8NSU9_9BACI|nr:YjcG family protein [Cerasibacillus terrae]TXL64090.1 hypothetical protein FHP05_10410 [Cerasibacillus terrae]
MKYGIALFPNKEIQDEANSYRKRYDSHYSLIPPHITVKDPFRMTEKEMKDLIPEMKKLANNMKPFTISIHKVSSFQPLSNTIYLKVEPVEELMELHEKLHSGKFPTLQGNPFIPHITIGQNLKDDEFSDVYSSCRMKSFKLEDRIDRFQLLYQLENGSWTVYETFVFGEEKL